MTIFPLILEDIYMYAIRGRTQSPSSLIGSLTSRGFDHHKAYINRAHRTWPMVLTSSSVTGSLAAALSMTWIIIHTAWTQTSVLAIVSALLLSSISSRLMFGRWPHLAKRMTPRAVNVKRLQSFGRKFKEPSFWTSSISKLRPPIPAKKACVRCHGVFEVENSLTSRFWC